MASINKITEMMAAMKTIYPYFQKDADVKTLVKTWSVLLNSYTDSAVEVAFYKCLQICKMPPTPADVIEQLNEMIKSDAPTAEELWNDFINILNKARKYVYRFNFTATEDNGLTQGQNARKEFKKLWGSLSDDIKQFVGGEGEMIRMAQADDDELKYEHSRFLKAIPTIQSRKETAELRKMIDGGDIMVEGTNKPLLTT